MNTLTHLLMRIEQMIDEAIKRCSHISHLNKILQKHLCMEFVNIVIKTYSEISGNIFTFAY